MIYVTFVLKSLNKDYGEKDDMRAQNMNPGHSLNF